jgi:PAS domain S-box-containing protein
MPKSLSTAEMNQKAHDRVGSKSFGGDKYAAIVAAAMDAIIVIDEHQAITVFNQAAESMFLLSVEQALGKPISILIPNRFHQSHDTHINNFAKSGVSQRSMNHLKPLSGVRTTGEEFPIEASISQVDSGDGRFFTVIVRDITQRTRSEEQNRRLAA